MHTNMTTVSLLALSFQITEALLLNEEQLGKSQKFKICETGPAERKCFFFSFVYNRKLKQF